MTTREQMIDTAPDTFLSAALAEHGNPLTGDQYVEHVLLARQTAWTQQQAAATGRDVQSVWAPLVEDFAVDRVHVPHCRILFRRHLDATADRRCKRQRTGRGHRRNDHQRLRPRRINRLRHHRTEIPCHRIAWVALALAVVSLILFTITMGGPLALLMAGVLGLAVFVSVSSFTAMAPPMYPVTVRARGYGLMVGISRIGAVVTPILAGYAADSFSAERIFLAASIPLTISAIAAARLWSVTRGELDREFADAAAEHTRISQDETLVKQPDRA